jgi:hypothetical protein
VVSSSRVKCPKTNNLTLEDGHGLQQWSYDFAWTRGKKNVSGVEGITNECKFGGKLCNFFLPQKKVYGQLPAKNGWVKIHFRKVDKYCSFV